jgi:hypothetical protein
MTSKFRTFALFATIVGAAATAASGRLRSWLWGPPEHRADGPPGHESQTVQEDRRPIVNGRRDFDRDFFRSDRHRRHLVRPQIKETVTPGFNIRPAVAQ